MPTYEYACKGKCGQHFDVQQSFSDAALTKCPTCGGKLRKVFGNIGIAFKGSGFYKTDSRSSNGSSSKTEASESKAASDSSSGSDKATKSESKSETKSETKSEAKADKKDKKPAKTAS